MAYICNGSDPIGFTFDEECASCPLGELSCPIAFVQVQHNYEQVGNASLSKSMDCLVDGRGICQMKPLIVELVKNTKSKIVYIDSRQTSLLDKQED